MRLGASLDGGQWRAVVAMATTAPTAHALEATAPTAHALPAFQLRVVAHHSDGD